MGMDAGAWKRREKEEVAAFIDSFFKAGKEKELTSLMGFHSSRAFTKFDNNPPYERQNSEEAFVHEQATFANISDYDYRIDELRVDLLGEVALATFCLAYSGVFVNDYSFEGMTVGSRARVTMVLLKEEGAWKMVHEHFSSFPELPAERPGHPGPVR